MEIINFKAALPHESNIAEFSIYIPQWNVTFHRFKLRRSKKTGHTFVAAPSFAEEMLDGSKKWSSFIEVSKDKKFDFDKKVMELVEPMLKDLEKGNMEEYPF